ncbi:MAG: SusC/RagA family TonB-linked outer membrane protein [Balneolales bacterium]
MKVRLQNMVLMSMLACMISGFFPDVIKAQEQDEYITAEVFKTSDLQGSFYHARIRANIQVDLNKASVDQALGEIGDLTGLKMVYRGDIIPDKEITLQDDMMVSDALEYILADTGLEYLIHRNGYIMINPAPESNENANAEMVQRTVTGTVTDGETGEALPGVNVVIEGTSTGATTDIDGIYNIDGIESGSVLVFSYVGYLSQEVTVADQDVINLSLEPDFAQLDEMVVVGYSAVKKSSLTSSISKVENVGLDQIPSGRAESALVGRLAGVHIRSSRTSPGAAPEITIRGPGSISAGNEPLIVIDGFPGGSFDNINMNDVESIEVLKDASSAAIYGSRGSGGVIIVTTKRGEEGAGPQFNLSTYYGMSNPMLYDDWLYGDEYQEYIERYENRDFGWTGGDTSLPMWGDPERPAQHQVNPIVGENANVNWEEEVITPSPIQNYSLSVSGGNDNINYYVSGTYKDEQGTIMNTGYQKYGVRANVNVDISPVVNAGFMLSPNYSERRTYPGGLQNIVKSPPFVSAERQADGSYLRPLNYWGTSVSTMVNPLATFEGTDHYINGFNNVGEMFLELDILENLSLRSSLGSNISYDVRDNFQETRATSATRTSGSADDRRNINLINENVLSYARDFNEVHSFAGILGASFQRANARRAHIAVEPDSYANEVIRTINNAIVSPGGTYTTKTSWGLASYFSRINYGFDDKYLLSASLRTDGSSRFGPENRWGYFPSASAAWRLSEESFMQGFDAINELKLRASYGAVGNFNIGNFQYLATIGDVAYSPGGVYSIGQAPSNFGNEDLKWERTESYDIGVELGLFSNRLNVVFDYYSKTTKDLLYNVGIPGISGFTSSLVNIGDVSNKGVELEINTRNLTGEFSWNTAFNFTRNRNEVLSIGGVDESINTHSRGMGWVLRVGEPMFSFYGYEQDGVLQTEEDMANSALKAGQEDYLGTVRYKDQNNDDIITPDDRVILGSFMPKFFMGMVNDFAYKNFDLSFVLQSSIGAQVYNLENLYYQGATISGMRRSLVEGQWWSVDEPGDGQNPATSLSNLGFVSDSDYYLEDASFLALRNVNLGYTLPASLTQRAGLSTTRVYVTMNNLLMLTKEGFHGYNPEGYSQGGIDGINSMPGFNNGVEPMNRVIAFGLNMNF